MPHRKDGVKRRAYLGLAGVATAGSLAGCSAETDADSTDDASTGDDPADGETDDSDDEPSPAELDEGQETLRLGDSVLFYTEDGSKELAFRPSDPTIRPVLVTDRPDQGLVASELPPDDALYLLVRLDAENVGERALDVPSTIELHIDGTRYSHVRTALNDEYEPFRELAPGDSTSQYAVFEIPRTSSDANARLTAEWGAVEPATAEWSVDLADAPRATLDLENRAVGDAVTLGTDEVRMTVEVQSVTESDDDDDRTSVLVTLRAENAGSKTVQDPTLRGVTLRADGREFDPAPYDGDDGYEAGELEPGASKRGVFRFRIPDAADPNEVRVALTRELDATWELDQ